MVPNPRASTGSDSARLSFLLALRLPSIDMGVRRVDNEHSCLEDTGMTIKDASC